MKRNTWNRKGRKIERGGGEMRMLFASKNDATIKILFEDVEIY